MANSSDKKALKKAAFVQALEESGGIVTPALKEVGITRRTYEIWRRDDPEFEAAVHDVAEMQIDYVEGQLMKLVAEGNPTATIFYLKAMGRRRGWNENYNGIQQTKAKSVAVAHEVNSMDGQKRVRAKRDYFVKLLKSQRKYSPEMSQQVLLTARLSVKCDILEAEIFGEGHEAVITQYSREGNARETISATEQLYSRYTAQLQDALRALGMNAEAKVREQPADSLGDFLEALKDDDRRGKGAKKGAEG